MEKRAAENLEDRHRGKIDFEQEQTELTELAIKRFGFAYRGTFLRFLGYLLFNLKLADSKGLAPSTLPQTTGRSAY